MLLDAHTGAWCRKSCEEPYCIMHQRSNIDSLSRVGIVDVMELRTQKFKIARSALHDTWSKQQQDT